VERFDINAIFSISNILPNRLNVCLDGGDINNLNTDAICSSLVSLMFDFRHPHI